MCVYGYCENGGGLVGEKAGGTQLSESGAKIPILMRSEWKISIKKMTKSIE